MFSVKLRPGNTSEVTPWPPASLHSSKQVTHFSQTALSPELSFSCLQTLVSGQAPVCILVTMTRLTPGSPGARPSLRSPGQQPPASRPPPRPCSVTRPPPPWWSVWTRSRPRPRWVTSTLCIEIMSCAWFSGGSLSSQSHHRVRVRLQQLWGQPDRQ